MPEKVFYAALCKILGDEVVKANWRICGYEADMVFSYSGGFMIVQYDGEYYHKSKEAISRDVQANEAHIASGNKVIRIREIGLPPLKTNHQSVQETYHEILFNPKEITQEAVEEVIRKIFLIAGINNENGDLSASWESIWEQARHEVSSRKTSIDLACEYVRFMLQEQKTPTRSSANRKNRGAKLDMRRKSLLSRSWCDDATLEFFALLEFFYCPRCTQCQNMLTKRGYPLNINKGSRFVGK